MKPSIDNSVLMQYATPLPEDYDIDKLNGRIKEVAPAFDNYPGMFFKLYAVNAAGPQVINEYSSIYLWAGNAENAVIADNAVIAGTAGK